jgi:hypothetical protein
VRLPYSWGRPTSVPEVYSLGGGDWEITWSPNQVHPYATLWLMYAARYGPPGRLAPPADLWAYSLQTQDLAD